MLSGNQIYCSEVEGNLHVRLARRRAVVVTVLLFCITSFIYLVTSSRHPFGDLNNGLYTDHFTHMNAARLFPSIGFDLLQKPINTMFRPLTDDEKQLLPSDLQSFQPG